MTARRLTTPPLALLLAATLMVPMQVFGQPSDQPVKPDAPAAQKTAADPGTLPLQEVTLYTSGVGYFEHNGTVAGDKQNGDKAEVRLTFQPEQLNDVLKSLAIWGDTGSVRVNYASKEPLSRRLASFSINLAGDPSLVNLLQQLKGATVTVSTPDPMTGRVLTVISQDRVVGDPPTQITEYSLVLVTEGGIKTVALDTVGSIVIEDPTLREELSEALDVLADARNKDTKAVSISFANAPGEAAKENRVVAVSYLIEMPVWKTTYRLDLTDAKAEPADAPTSAADSDPKSAPAEGASAPGSLTSKPDKAPQKPKAPEGDPNSFLQGWGIVENTTESDWTDVKLTLVSGRPISFIQDLYTPLYVTRPTVQPELYASLMPKRYDGGFGEADGRREQMANDAPMDRAMRFAEKSRRGSMSPSPSAGAEMASEAMDDTSMVTGNALREQENAPLSLAAMQSAASGGSVGELFQYSVDAPVTLARQQSAMLPILSGKVHATKVSIYNQSTQPKHPLLGARMVNSTDQKLMAGPITIYDSGTYAGDAQIGHMAPNEDRLLSYAVDLEVQVDPSTKADNAIVGAKINRGVLQVQYKYQYTQTYTIKNAAGKDKTLIIEHPRYPQRELVEPKKFAERTENLYRFRVGVEEESQKEFNVIEELVTWQQVSIVGNDVATLLTYAQNGKISKDVRDALTKAIALRQDEAELRRQINEIEARYQNIARDQNRIRENMARVDRNTSLYKTYIEKLSSQEKQVEELLTKKEALTQEAEAKARALSDYIEGLTINE